MNIQFTDDDFADFKNLLNDKTNNKEKAKMKRYIPKKTRNVFRNLENPKMEQIQQLDIFSQKAKGIQPTINLKINPGINSDIMGADWSLLFDSEEYLSSSIKNNSQIQYIIDKLASISKAGNQLAKELYDEIKEKLEQILNEISIQLNAFKNLLIYYDINPIFNSTLELYSYDKLPYDIIKVSNELLSKLSGIFTNIRNGNVKTYSQILYNDIYNYIDESKQLITNMLNNMKNLTHILITKNNTFTAITNYYSNNTSTSYINLINVTKKILDEYYIKEYDTIYPKIQELKITFEENANDSLKENISTINELYNNLLNKSYIINNATEEDYQTVLSNLENSKKYPNDIIIKIKNYIDEIINLKENGFFISNQDIINFNEAFYSILTDADEVAKRLYDINLIDKVFDEIMIKFRDNYIYTLKYMEQIKSGNFTLEEDVLKKSSFNQTIKEEMESDIKKINEEILTKIKIDNNYEIIKTYLNSFLDNNLDDLNNLISDLEIIFSEEALQSLSDSFELSLNSSLEKITAKINKNINLSKQYYDKYYDVINNNDGLKSLISNYMLNNPTHPSYTNQYISQWPDFDEIKQKEHTMAYLAKYNRFMANIDYSEDYINYQLYYDILHQYKEVYMELNEYLKIIKNIKLNEIFSDFEEIDFYKNHLKIIDKLNSRLDKYFSNDLFEKKYSEIINQAIDDNIQLLKSIKEYINTKHTSISNLPLNQNDYSDDFCIIFRRKVCYGCTNCVAYTFFFDRICYTLSPYQYNYLELEKISFESINDIDNFYNQFNDFNNSINIKIENYYTIINNLTSYVDSLQEKTITKNISMNYFDSLKKWINNTLINKYEEIILKNVYNYFKENIDRKMEIIFSDIFQRWREMYISLFNDVANNTLNIKYSLFEFSMIGSIYQTIITTDLIKDYYDSIILFEKSEMNYTISYYYNYLIKLINKSYKYIINKIQINEYMFNDNLKERKQEIKNIYNIFIDDIIYSENYCLNEKNQLNILNINESDFFLIKSIMEKNIKETNETIADMNDKIAEYEFDLPLGDDYSLVMRLFLENKELGKFIETYYAPIDKEEEEFFYLNLNKFKDVMVENWVFDDGDFIYILNNALFETNKEIKNDLSLKMENYTNLIEKEITKFFDDDIENIISELYREQIKDLTKTQKKIINQYFKDILFTINEEMQNEATKIKENPGIFLLNNDQIKQKLIDYKNIIIKKLNYSIFNVLDEFHENVYENIYINCIEDRLNKFLATVKTILSSSSEYKEFKLVNSSYKIDEIIYNLTQEIIDNYKTIVIKKIDFKYTRYYEGIKNSIFNQLINDIDLSIDQCFENILLPELKPSNNCTNTYQCQIFSFKNETKIEINNCINENMNKIKAQMNVIKGNNYEVNFNCPYNFTNSEIDVILYICDSFKRFLSFENQEQGTKINEYIQEFIKNNLDDFLNNVIPTFGNPFFERIIDFNINFKIVNLYQNIYHSLGQSILYYKILDAVRDVGDLPIDLENRLINLNDLDITIIKKQNDIKNLLEKKLSELINNLKNTAKETYINNLKESDIIKNNFNSDVLDKIDTNLEEIMPDIEKKYKKNLEKYLKEQFTTAFTDILEQKSNETLRVFYEEKENLTGYFDLLFTSNRDNDLREVNQNINSTLQSIRNYENYQSTFTISNSVINFFTNYGYNILVPPFNQFDIDLNKITKSLIMNSINNKSLIIERLNLTYYPNLLYNIQNNIDKDYLDVIINKIESYGKTEISYESNLIYTKNEIYKRITSDNQMEDEEEAKKNIATQDVEETFVLLKSLAYNDYTRINKLDAFINIYNIMSEYINIVNIEKKNIKNMIIKNKYNKEIYIYLSNKLDNLANILTTFYYYIYNTNYSVINHLYNRLYTIYNYFVYISQYTRNVLNKEYESIYNETKKINYKYSNFIEVYKKTSPYLPYESKSDHMITYADASAYNLKEYIEMKLDLILKGNYYEFKRPIFFAKIETTTIPERVEVDIYSKYGKCGYEGHLYNITFDKVNFTTTVEYDTKSSIINITTYSDIKKYNYSEIVYERSYEEITVARTFNGRTVYFTYCNRSSEDNFTVFDNMPNEIPGSIYNNSIIVTK
jgi:hypothetical protein